MPTLEEAAARWREWFEDALDALGAGLDPDDQFEMDWLTREPA
jgi:hypothetical protein